MRSSIAAQSMESVPPAPALISTKQLLAIVLAGEHAARAPAWPGPPPRRRGSRPPPGCWPRHRPRCPARRAPSRRRARAARAPPRATLASRAVFSFSSPWALVLSSQKLGSVDSRSISAMRLRLRSRSKIPPERVQPLPKGFDSLHRVGGHGCGLEEVRGGVARRRGSAPLSGRRGPAGRARCRARARSAGRPPRSRARWGGAAR